jgi:hypothetical protein
MPITEGGTFTPDNRIVSPGVFTRENDVSGITQGIADIGAVVVAPFAQGPGFSPTLITNTADLQQMFGVPDGTYYGSYTANEYLTQKGFVTVCRVGALTGYNQSHPLVVYAQAGRWERNYDIGSLNGNLSFIEPFGSFTGGYSGSLTLTTSSLSNGWYTGSLYFSSPTFAVTFQGVSGTATASVNPLSSSFGSLLFNGQSTQFVTTANYTASVFFTGSGLATASWPLTGSALTSFLASSGAQLTGSLAGATNLAPYGTDPFDGKSDPNSPNGPISLTTASFTLNNNAGCSNPTFNLTGYLSGSFGQYNGTFRNNSVAPFLNNCGLLVTGSGSNVILAVLGDTLAGGINPSTLTAPGFSGSYVLTSSILNSISSSITQEYSLVLSSSNGFGWGIYNFNINASNNDYILNSFNDVATVGNPATQVVGQKIPAAYLYATFPDSMAAIAAAPDDWIIQVAAPSQFGTPFSGSVPAMTFTDQYSLNPTAGDSIFSLTNATTPWVTSQAVAGVNGTKYRYQLFQIATLSDGTYTNTQYKIEISNVRLAGTVPGSDWGTFTLSVRAFGDTENRPQYIESYQNVTLDPTSDNFVARAIGDQYSFITAGGKVIEYGIFKNVSSVIRVVMSTNNYPVSAVPYGFSAYQVPFGGLATDSMTPPMLYTKASTSTNAPGKFASGIVLAQTLTSDPEVSGLYPTSSAGTFIYEDNLDYFFPLPSNTTIGSNVGFHLDNDYTASGVGVSAFISSSTGGINAIPATLTSNESTYVKMRRFVFGFQGGFDGQSPATVINTGVNITAGNTQGLNCATISSAGSVAYNQCIGALSNSGVFDINMIVTPGIFYSLHSYVAQTTIDMCEGRGDCFYIMDNTVPPSITPIASQADGIVNSVSTIDSNYVATYYPWVTILDTNINQIVSVPPSVVLPAVYAASDNASAEWFAPAGLNRGGIPQATGVLDRLTHGERDTLYIGRVNPIATFAGTGIAVWGQKTLQVADSALNRVSVRRLLINLKKFIASTSQYLVFEQNTSTTQNRFLSVVNPYLESVQQRSGLYAFKVVCDGSNNTPDVVDENILYGQIYIQPTKTAEYIIIDFNILPTGASFSS